MSGARLDVVKLAVGQEDRAGEPRPRDFRHGLGRARP